MNPEGDDLKASSETRLVTYIISPPVRAKMEKDPATRIDIIICPAEDPKHPDLGVGPARDWLSDYLSKEPDTKARVSDFYVFASLLPSEISDLAANPRVWQIWLDHEIKPHLLTSVNTIKASACWRTFEARGKGITWAVLDSGIKYNHPHFASTNNIDQTLSKNFSASVTEQDRYGHGTHVAGIIAGCASAVPPDRQFRVATYLDDPNTPRIDQVNCAPSGVAPLARLVNVKVLDDDGSGSSSAAILGLQYLRKLNASSRNIQIDGANLSLGYPFDPKWYGCGHSPLCEEVQRTVNSGIVVVISAGNSGYGTVTSSEGGQVPVYLALSIEDPGNTDAAITVGSAHKSAPHSYGVSFFSSKGPTGDGRLKPDLVAPGEKIISCSTHWDDPNPTTQYDYEEMSGTSMAAPHVAGAIAAFLSVHQEFRGDPGSIKEIFLKTATDLRRDRAFQGAGLVDLMRAMMSV